MDYTDLKARLGMVNSDLQGRIDATKLQVISEALAAIEELEARNQWQPIATAPKDGTVFISRNADHPDWGSQATLRNISWIVCEKTEKPKMIDNGGWIFVSDNHWFGRETKRPYVPFAVAPDKYNTSVRLEWMPFPQ